MAEQLTAAQIRTRLESDQYGYHDDGDDWDYALAELLRMYGLDVAIAWTYAHEQHDKDVTFSPDDIDNDFQRVYQQQWDTAAEFAQHVAEGETEMGDPEESKGRAWFLENYSEFIDWQRFAESPKIGNSYSLIMLDPENSRVVYAFEMDA